MKKKIHPEYHSDAKVICGCGNVFTTGSTQKEIHVEICSNCHPLFTGKQKVVDTQGRVERFKRIKEKSTAKVTARLTHKKAKAKK
jgi:large subunit ribosomal protein L31